MGEELAPEDYPFTKTPNLLRQLKCAREETLRRRVERFRKKVTKFAEEAGDPPPSTDAVIENIPWHGYPLNPTSLRHLSSKKLEANK